MSKGFHLILIAFFALALGWTLQAGADNVSADTGPATATFPNIKVDLVANPPHLVAGKPTTLQYRLVYTDTGAPVTNLVIDHEQIVHVLLISTDLTDMQHVRPAETAPGVYEVSFTPAVDSHYIAYAAFNLGREGLQDIRHLPNHSGQLLHPSLALDLRPKDVNRLRVIITPPAEIHLKEPALFRIRVERSDGEDVRDLEPYLGAAAYVVVASEDGHQIMPMYVQPAMHEHDGMSEMATPTGPFGPYLDFTHTFAEAGFYRIWIQIRHEGQIITAPFAIQVK